MIVERTRDNIVWVVIATVNAICNAPVLIIMQDAIARFHIALSIVARRLISSYTMKSVIHGCREYATVRLMLDTPHTSVKAASV